MKSLAQPSVFLASEPPEQWPLSGELASLAAEAIPAVAAASPIKKSMASV